MTYIEVTTQAELDAALASANPDEYTNITIKSERGVWLRLEDSGNATVEACGNATVRACGNATVEAWGNATVEACGNATVRAGGVATVRARGNAGVHAKESAEVTAGAQVAVWLHSAHVTVQGGVIIDVTSLDMTDPATWCADNSLNVNDGKVTLYKALDENLTAGQDWGRPTTYTVGQTVTAEDWIDDNKCGGGFHVSPTVGQATSYREDAARWVRVEAALTDLRPIVSGDGAPKCKVRTCLVVAEVDRHGNDLPNKKPTAGAAQWTRPRRNLEGTNRWPTTPHPNRRPARTARRGGTRWPARPRARGLRGKRPTRSTGSAIGTQRSGWRRVACTAKAMLTLNGGLAWTQRSCTAPKRSRRCDQVTLRIGSLCSGYGGLDMSVMDVLDAEVAWHAQYDPDDRHQYAAQILAHHWPGLPNHGDITAIDWAAVEPVDILTAGFPCQPVSNAGKRKGHEDERWLWPDVEAAIRRIQPRLVFLENVSALANRGGDTVLGALAALGFDAEWTCLRASDIGAPHRRDRWFCLAWPASDPAGLSQREPADAPLAPTGSREAWEEPGRRGARAPADSQGLGWVEGRTESARELGGSDASFGGGAAPADADRAGALAERDGEPDRSETVDEHAVQDVAGRVLGWGPYAPAIERWGHVMGRPAPAPTEPGKNGPRLAPRFVEWLMGLRDGHVTAVPGIPRNAQLKALGNGVVHHQGAAALRLLLDRLEH